MEQIYLNSGNRGLDFETFSANLIEICNQHKNQKRALAFAFILYNFNTPHLNKVLRDDDYWMDLHVTSGKYLTVFSINYNDKPNKAKNRRGSRYTQFLTNVNSFRDIQEGNCEILTRYFDLEGEIKYPAILFFQVNENDVTDAFIVELIEKTIEPGFLEIKSFIEAAVEQLKAIAEINRNDYSRVFEQLKIGVQHAKFLRLKPIKRIISMVSLLSSIRTLFA